MEPSKNYSAADIERYYNGQMTDAECHALEKAALDDPFLSDALDGYVHTATPVADVTALRAQLQNRKRRVVAMPVPRMLWGAAAFLILLAGFGWLSYRLSQKKDSDLAVQRERATPVALPKNNPAADSISTIEQSKTISNQQLTDTVVASTLQAAPLQQQETKPVKQFTPTARTLPPSVQTFSKAHAPAAQMEQGDAAGNNTTVFRGRVVDVKNNPLSNAIVLNELRQAIANTDVRGDFSIIAPDSNLTVTVQSVGYMPQQTTLSPTDTAMDVVLQPASATLNEVVVLKKKNAETKPRVRVQDAEPIGGWEQFNEYVDTHIGSPENLAENQEEKEVTVRFDVDEGGNAVHLSVARSNCNSCDSTAVRLIGDGTKWKQPKAGARPRVRIRF